MEGKSGKFTSEPGSLNALACRPMPSIGELKPALMTCIPSGGSVCTSSAELASFFTHAPAFSLPRRVMGETVFGVKFSGFWPTSTFRGRLMSWLQAKLAFDMALFFPLAVGVLGWAGASILVLLLVVLWKVHVEHEHKNMDWNTPLATVPQVRYPSGIVKHQTRPDQEDLCNSLPKASHKQPSHIILKLTLLRGLARGSADGRIVKVQLMKTQFKDSLVSSPWSSFLVIFGLTMRNFFVPCPRLTVWGYRNVRCWNEGVCGTHLRINTTLCIFSSFLTSSITLPMLVSRATASRV